jgi:hypothetical protein
MLRQHASIKRRSKIAVCFIKAIPDSKEVLRERSGPRSSRKGWPNHSDRERIAYLEKKIHTKD